MSIHTPELPSDQQPSEGPRNPIAKMKAAKAEAKAAKAHAKATRRKKQRWQAAGLLLILIIALAAVGAVSDDSKPTASENTSQASQSEKPAAQEKPAAEKPAAEKKPEMTSGQENALESAQSYIDMTGFSKAGLIQQLSSSAGEGYSKADATFAANHVDVDWNAEAVESAQSYLDMTGFSKAGLIQQLSSSAGEGFTPAQARYAVSKVY